MWGRQSNFYGYMLFLMGFFEKFNYFSIWIWICETGVGNKNFFIYVSLYQCQNIKSRRKSLLNNNILSDNGSGSNHIQVSISLSKNKVSHHQSWYTLTCLKDFQFYSEKLYRLYNYGSVLRKKLKVIMNRAYYFTNFSRLTLTYTLASNVLSVVM